MTWYCVRHNFSSKKALSDCCRMFNDRIGGINLNGSKSGQKETRGVTRSQAVPLFLSIR